MTALVANPRQLSAGLVAGLALLAGLAFYATGRSPVASLPSPPHQFDRYYGLGPDAGTKALQEDMDRDHPRGSDLGSLLTRLDRAGFECRPEGRPSPGFVCQQRRAMQDNHTGRITLDIRSAEVTVASVTATLAIASR